MDERTRCDWGSNDSEYLRYHDFEWGVPEYDDRALFEKLVLDGFQAGLSWLTILRKRDNFRIAFDGFQPEKMARWDEQKCASLLANAGIIRNRQKILASIENAKAWLQIMERGSFSTFMWDFVDGQPKINHWHQMAQIPSQTERSAKMSHALKANGFRFCGPTICYAVMQATGMVNDHLVGCFRHQEVMGVG